MIYNHQEHFTNAVEFIDFLQNEPFFQTKNIFEANVVGTGGHIYRGQPDSTWELKPSVFRSFNALNDFTPQPPGNFTKDQKERWLGLHMHAELRSIFIFLEAADKLGIETPIDYSRVKDHYAIMQQAINDGEYDGEKKFPSEKALEELSLAQHHGIPTRILDWSESQLIACFFAVTTRCFYPYAEGQ